jgi:plastocyanin
MKRRSWLLGLVGGGVITAMAMGLAAAQELGLQPPAGANPNQIVAQRQAFDPGYLTVPAGTTVTWVNRDRELHTVTSDVGLFNGQLGPRERFSFTFDEPGVFFFFCQPHDWMIGEVTVVASDQGAEGPVTAASVSSQPMGDVAMLGYEFQPASITIPVGGMVSWTNFDAEQHTASSPDAGGWTTAVLNGGQSESIQFTDVGTYPYVCVIHPSMIGEIIVT